MKLKAAKALRDTIRQAGIHCIVPLGHGPGGYFARIFTMHGPRDFRSRAAFDTYELEKAVRQAEWHRLRALMQQPRSPIDLMIDRACGITEADYER